MYEFLCYMVCDVMTRDPVRLEGMDPDFDESPPAVYYVRVLEIPTPRWSTYDAKALGRPLPESVPASIQERAWSSPIWYTPVPELVTKQDFYPGLRQVLPK